MRPVPAKMATKLMLAADLFAERGLDGTKTEDIAAATGIPKATLYYYFEGKEQVLSYIFGIVLDAVGRAVASAVEGPGDAAERMRRLIRAHIRVFADYPRASQALQFDLGRAARFPEVVERSNNAFIGPVTTLIEEGIAEGTFRGELQPRLTAVGILGLINTSSMYVITRDVDVTLEGIIDGVSAFALGGLLKADRS
jgi:TetR/AcrR family transcriptional regulator